MDDPPLDLSLYVFLWLLYIKMRMNARRRSAQLAQILEVWMRLHTASTWSGRPSPTSLQTPFRTLHDYAQHCAVDLGYSALQSSCITIIPTCYSKRTRERGRGITWLNSSMLIELVQTTFGGELTPTHLNAHWDENVLKVNWVWNRSRRMQWASGSSVKRPIERVWQRVSKRANELSEQQSNCIINCMFAPLLWTEFLEHVMSCLCLNVNFLIDNNW